MAWLYRSPRKRSVISLFKWFLPAFAMLRGGGVGTLWVVVAVHGIASACMRWASPPSIHCGLCRVSSKETKKNFVSNWNKPKQDLFRLCFSLFHETKNKNFCLFRFVSVFQTYIETTETNRIVLKQTETNKKTLNFLKSTLYQTVLVGLRFVSDQSKHRKLSVSV